MNKQTSYLRTTISLRFLLTTSLIVLFSLSSFGVIEISTIEELQKIGNDPSYPMNGSYVLTNDIDARVTKDWNDGAGFIPLGSNTSPFMGQFNGNGHVISNLYINGRVSNLLDSGYVGLFRRVESGAVVEKLGLENCFMISAQYIAGITVQNSGTISQCFVTGYIAGDSYIGGVVGTNYGTISQCYSTAYIMGESYIGGIVGYNSGTVAQCYSNSNVTGISNVGGLVGINSNTISQCYSVGAVLGTLYTGGLVGTNYNTVTQSYWNVETSGQSGSSGGVGKTTAEMKQKATYTGWDFDYYWGIVENVTYPYIQDLGPIPSMNAPVERELWSLKDLDRIGKDWDYPWNGKYYLMTDIDAKETNQWNNGEGFSPIYPFCGEFYGNGYAITNLYINCQNKSHIGLFEKVILGKVYDLQMLDVWFVGNNYVGGFAGYNSGTIEKSHITGFIMGYEYVGGIVGFNIGVINVTSFEGSLIGNNSCGGIVGYNYGSIFLSYSVGRITGNYIIGGLVGNNYDGTVNQCYSTGEVTGASYVGGLAGYNLGTIEKCYSMSITSGSDGIGGLVGRNFDTISECYSAGAVSGTSNTGGLVGYTSGGVVSNSYWDMETSGQTSSAGGEGRTTVEMKTQANYVGWDFISIWGIIEDITYPYLLGLGMTQSYTEPPEIEIWTLDDLLKIGTTPDYPYDGHYVLIADIDASETIGWNNGKGFTPISLFAGVFNGNAHTISNLYINQYNQSYLALFGKLVGGKIKNLYLQNVWVCGDENISGLVALNYGVISNCHVTGIISGSIKVGGIVGDNYNRIEKSWFKGYINGKSNVGGITGINEYGANIDTCYSVALISGVEDIGGLTGANLGTIIQCYSTEEVRGDRAIGGLVGYNSGAIEQCYSKGRVIGGVDTGGLVGVNYSSVTDSYWDVTTSGQPNSAGGEGRTTTQMKTQSNYVGWNFPGIWRIIEGVSYPYLAELGPTQTPPAIPISIDIWSIEDLNKIGRNWNYPWNATYNLRADIDASDTINWDGGKGFNPIDTFTGILNGNGYSIRDLYINRPDEDIVSLFRTLHGGEIRNTKIDNAFIVGNINVGGLVGINTGLISKCIVSGSITGNLYVGGLISFNYGISSLNFVLGDVEGDSSIAGLVNQNYGTITLCYSMASVTGNRYVAGLVNGNEGSIDTCYAVGSVQGVSFLSGLIGNSSGSSAECYWDTEATGQATSPGGGVGKTTAEMKQQATYSGWDFFTTWAIIENASYPYFIWDGSPQVACPNVVGLDKALADIKLSNVGLNTGSITYQCSDTIPENTVITQNPKSRRIVSWGSSVDLIVSTGPCPEGEGSLEGVPEGAVEGTPEGTVEGAIEGVSEGVVEGSSEGSAEGEGSVEGMPEGPTEGTSEGEGVIEGEGVVEGTTEGTSEGEGSSEGTTEGSVEGERHTHSADQNRDWQINLSELLRVIQLFNIGGYHCALPGEQSEDGYIPGYEGDKTCSPHASDYNPQDWQIKLSELLRLIQFFNVGGYHLCPDGEDGYCPGIL